MKKNIAAIAIVLAVGLAAYSNTFHGPFQYDEVKHILSNPVIRDLSLPADAVRHDPELYKFVRQRPVGVFSFALNYRFQGTTVEGYHAVNLLIHLAAASLAFVLVRLVLASPVLGASVLPRHGALLALLVSLFFVSHPIQTQAVTYVHQRYASLAALFSLLAVVLYGRWRTSGADGGAEGRQALRWSWYAGALLSTVLAMKTKENAFTLPVLLALFELFFFPRRGGKAAALPLPVPPDPRHHPPVDLRPPVGIRREAGRPDGPCGGGIPGGLLPDAVPRHPDLPPPAPLSDGAERGP